jgi:hypothetical protein
VMALASSIPNDDHHLGHVARKQVQTNLRILPKMARPCSMVTTMVENASSLSTMSAASRATCVPRCPMATPMSAFFNAGASLTPSPVIATTYPSFSYSLLNANGPGPPLPTGESQRKPGPQQDESI